MPLKIEPMREEDYFQTGKEVREDFGDSNVFMPAPLNSPSISDSVEYAPEEDGSADINHKRGHIHLCRPVTNFAITQEKVFLLQKITHSDEALTKRVVGFRTCYDVGLNDYISVDDMTHSEGVPWGAEILKKWIDDFDVKTGVRECLIDVMDGYRKTYGGAGTDEFYRTSFGGHLAAGDWGFFPADNSTYEGLYLCVSTTVFYSNNSCLSYLVNLQGHKDRLHPMITGYVVVTPLGIHLDIASRCGQVPIAYDEIISANKNIKMVMSGMFDARAFAAGYKWLSDKIHNLLVHPTSYKSNCGFVVEKLTFKQSDIRAKMLGKRVDYSGHSTTTIDLFLSIRKVKLPKDMTPKLFRSHLLSSMSNPSPSDWVGMDKYDKYNSKLISSGILDRVPMVIRRQPTLRKPSMWAFKAELTDERSLQINPLCVTDSNVNFGGDQMRCRASVSEGAVEEVKELMSIERDIYYPKDSECSVTPRQEIIYGLNVCTRAILQKGSSTKSYSGYRELPDDLFMQCMRVQDTVTPDGYTECAGRAAFATRLPKEVFSKFDVKEVTSKTTAPYVEAMLDVFIDSAIGKIDGMAELGFKVGYIYPPTFSLLGEEDISYGNVIEESRDSMKEMVGYYERGLEEEFAFTGIYDKGFERVEQRVKDAIYNRVGKESGFVRLAESGTRDGKSNLAQMYGYEGRVQESSRESLRAVTEHPYAEQLTPFEYFTTAYDGRQGFINKSLNVADTGHAMREMWRATSPYVIVGGNCSMIGGIEIRKSDIARSTTETDEVESIFREIITGWHVVRSDVYINKEMARELLKKNSVVKIRSVITCEDPCCKKCYGDDPFIHRPVAVGLPIGFIVAQSIDEPDTQLSMDSFKRGGIAPKSGVTSAFEKLEAHIECKDLPKNRNFGSYDPVARESGETHETYGPDGTRKATVGDSKLSKRLPTSAPLRRVAKKGEDLGVERGDCGMKELLMYTDVPTAQFYFIYTLCNTCKSEGEVNMKHFEVSAAATTVHIVISTGRDDLYAGQHHDSIQMCKGSLANTISVPAMKGVKTIQPSRTHTLSRVIMESIKMDLASSVLLDLTDPLEYLLNRVVMGQEIYCGGTGELLDERKM